MVKHVLKTGEVKKDISGHKVKQTDCPHAYEILKGVKKNEKTTRNHDIRIFYPVLHLSMLH